MILTAGKERIRFVKFATVGALGALIDFAVMNLFTHLGLARNAGSVSFICAVLSNFNTLTATGPIPILCLRYFLHQLGMFFLVNAAGIAFRIPTLHYEPVMASA